MAAVIDCPKCGYRRQPSDASPDYECPKCKIVFSKFQAVCTECKETSLGTEIKTPGYCPKCGAKYQVVTKPAPITRRRLEANSLPQSTSAYLDYLRGNTSYPFLRNWNTISTVLEAIVLGIAAIYALALIINPAYASNERLTGFAILGGSVIAYVALRGAHELIKAIVDVADSTVTFHAANSGNQESQ